MSNTYAKFHPIEWTESTFGQMSTLDVTAFVGGEHGHCIQLTMRNDYITLSELQIKELIKVLQARLDGTVTATGCEEMGEYYADHKKELNEVPYILESRKCN